MIGILLEVAVLLEHEILENLENFRQKSKFTIIMFGTLWNFSLKQGWTFGFLRCGLQDRALGYRDGRDRAETHRARLTSWLQRWIHLNQPHLRIGIKRYFLKVREISRAEIENKISSQKLISVEIIPKLFK